jgi:hypothetical protein
MFQETALITLRMDWDTALTHATRSLEEKGLQVLRSFDLQMARSVHANCSCPHHGTAKCDCQMVVLLVYAPGKAPITLVVHGHDGQVSFVLVDSPQESSDQQVVMSVRRLLVPDNFADLTRESWANAT